MKRRLLRGRIVRRNSIESGALLHEDGVIADADYRGEVPEDAEVSDFGSDYILPGFIELHAHGGGGYDFIDSTEEAFGAIMSLHRAHGVTRLCPTLTAGDTGKLFRFLELCERLKDTCGFGGVHLEGPFLSPQMCGAQNPAYIIEPTAELTASLAAHSDVLARITAAPEINGVEALAKTMLRHGVAMSIGHSAADAETVRRAFDWGFNQVTHLFCSTSQRMKYGGFVRGGIVEEALLDGDCFVELIGDGHHVSPESFLLTLKCKGVQRVCAVSDAMRAAGTPAVVPAETPTGAPAETPTEAHTGVSESYLGEITPANRVILEDGVAKLPDRSSFAGSLAVGDTMVKALCGYGLPLTTVSRMMSESPAALLGLADAGKLLSGCRADIAVLDRDYSTKSVFVSGNPVL